jgi:hypothetical protein
MTKTYLLRLRATALVDAESAPAAEQAWIDGCERDIELDTEGGLLGIEIYDFESEASRSPSERVANCQALDLIANIMGGYESNPDALDAIAKIVRNTGREILGASS